MKFTKLDNRDFDLKATAAQVIKVRDELESAWGADDEFVAGLTAATAGHDDNSTEEIIVTFEPDIIADAVDVLENSDDDEVRDAAEEARKAMDAHNQAAIEEAERAAEA